MVVPVENGKMTKRCGSPKIVIKMCQLCISFCYVVIPLTLAPGPGVAIASGCGFVPCPGVGPCPGVAIAGGFVPCFGPVSRSPVDVDSHSPPAPVLRSPVDVDSPPAPCCDRKWIRPMPRVAIASGFAFAPGPVLRSPVDSSPAPAPYRDRKCIRPRIKNPPPLECRRGGRGGYKI